MIGFAVSSEGALALARPTKGVGVGISPDSAGAPPAAAEVAREVGRPMASAPPAPSLRAEVPGTPREALPAAGGAAGDLEEWLPTDMPAKVDIAPESGLSFEELPVADVQSLLRSGYSKNQLKRLARAYGVVKWKTVQTLMGGAMASIL